MRLALTGNRGIFVFGDGYGVITQRIHLFQHFPYQRGSAGLGNEDVEGIGIMDALGRKYIGHVGVDFQSAYLLHESRGGHGSVVAGAGTDDDDLIYPADVLTDLSDHFIGIDLGVLNDLTGQRRDSSDAV